MKLANMLLVDNTISFQPIRSITASSQSIDYDTTYQTFFFFPHIRLLFSSMIPATDDLLCLNISRH